MVLAERWPDAELTGLDSSAEMIEAARQAHPEHRWVPDDIAQWAQRDSGQYDVVLSNAALQWVPDHAAVYPRLLTHAAPGGALAVQVPSAFDSPAHRILREMTASAGWRHWFPTGRVATWHSHEPAFYYDLLTPLAARVDLWETEYLHVLPDAGAILDWYKGTGMRPYLEAIRTEADRERFTAEYLEGLRTAYRPRPNGRVLFPFRRIFAIAQPPAGDIKSAAPDG